MHRTVWRKYASRGVTDLTKKSTSKSTMPKIAESSIPFSRTHTTVLVAIVLAGLGAGIPAAAQNAQDTELPSVIVTGTRSLNRTIADTEAPIDVLSSKDLQSTGSSELATALSRLLPSLNFGRAAVADTASAVRPAQLRGLSPDQTLVLVDGKRWHTSAVVNVSGTIGRGSAPADLNTIPLSAIERVEVLRDGASAQYGSDAIAGVINIILRHGASGGDVQIGAGQYSRGDGGQGNVSTSIGSALGEQGWVRLSAEVRGADPSNRAGADLRNPAEPLYGQVTQVQGDPKTGQSNVGVNLNLPLDNALDLYGFANNSRRTTDVAATWRTAYSSGTTLRSPLYPQGFLPNEAGVSTDNAVVIGVRNQAADWRWDASVNYGTSEFDITTNNSANLSLPGNQKSFYDGNLKNTQTVLNLDIVRDITQPPIGEALTVAFGVEARQDEYRIIQGEPNSYAGSGAQGFAGFQPSNAGTTSRSASAVYLNLESELSRKASASVALRYENYSDFGSVTSGKASGRYEAAPGISLRAAASTGFRAPSLAQQSYATTTSNLVVVNGAQQLLDTGTFAVNSQAAKALGAKPLEAEKSRNLSLGAAFQIGKNSSVTVDAYQIDIDNRILYSGNLVLPANLQQSASVAAARYFANALDTTTRGLDIVGAWTLPLAPTEKLTGTLGYNINTTTVNRVADNPAVLAANGLTLIDRQTILRATDTAPKDKLILSADYLTGPWTVHGVATRYGSFLVPQNNAALDQSFSANWVADASVSYHWSKSTVTVGVDNIGDQYPDQITSAGNLNQAGTLPYSTFSPYGFNGRYVYAKAVYAW